METIESRDSGCGTRRNELLLAAYHWKSGAESALNLRVRPRDVSDRPPSAEELQNLLLGRLGLQEEGDPASAGDEGERRSNVTWRLRNVTQEKFVPASAEDASLYVEDGDLLEVVDYSVAGAS